MYLNINESIEEAYVSKLHDLIFVGQNQDYAFIMRDPSAVEVFEGLCKFLIILWLMIMIRNYMVVVDRMHQYDSLIFLVFYR